MTTDATTQYLDRGEGRIAYDVTGSGPLVVAVPGMGELRSAYRHLSPALADAGFRVATMDLRGHGDSDTSFTAYDDPGTASDISALIEHLGGPALVIGNSMGAAASVIVAAENPSLVSGLVLIGPFVRNPSASAWQRMMFRVMMGGPWARLAWLSYYPTLVPSNKNADYAEHRSAIGAALARPGYSRAFRKTTHVSHAPAEAALPKVSTNVLVVMGTKDPDFPDQQAEAQFIVDRIGGRVVMVPDAGHYPQSEFPELTTPAVLEFARTVAAGRTDA